MQTSVQIPTNPPLSGATLVGDINAALQTLATDSSGSVDPAANAFPYSLWADTANGVLKRRNAAGTDWVVVAPLLSELTPLNNLPWMARAVGEPFGLRDDLTGVVIPPTNDPRCRYIKLTAGDAYNSGVLGSESVSGTAPLITATAVITLAGSPINGLTVNLWNTERRSPRGGSAGTLQDDQARVALINDGATILGNAQVQGTGNTFRFDKGDSEVGVVGSSITETRVRNQGVTYYMRVL